MILLPKIVVQEIVIGCDRSASMLSEAKAQTPVLCTPAAEMPYRPATFDRYTASFVVSRLQDYRAGLIEAHRALKPGSCFCHDQLGCYKSNII